MTKNNEDRLKFLFTMRRNNSGSKDVRQIMISVDYKDGEPMEDIVFRRFHNSKHKANVETIEQMIAHLNHFCDYTTDIMCNEDMENIILDIMHELDEKLNADRVEKAVTDYMDKYADDDSVVYRNVEVKLYKEVMEEIFLNNHDLMDLVIDYNNRIMYNNMVSVPGVTNKLTEADCFIIHCLILYSKLMYVPYFRLTVNVGFIEIVRDVLIKLGNRLNERICGLFPQELLDSSFISRLYAFLLNACAVDFDRHKKNIERYAVAGVSKESTAMRSIFDEMLSAFNRISLQVKMDSTDLRLYDERVTIADWDIFGLVTTNTASYIQKTKRRVADNKLGNIKPSYVLKVLSTEDDGGTEMSATSRFEIQAEKVDKEQYQYMQENKAYIIDDIYNKLGRKADVDLIYDSVIATTRDSFCTDLNKMIVSFILMKRYGMDVSNILSLKEFLIICLYAHERLFKYPELAAAILGKVRGRLNNVEITSNMFSDRSFLMHAEERVLGHLSKICSCDYIIVSANNNVSNTMIVTDDLIDWINDGMPI